MAFRDRFKQIFSTGQASAVEEAKRLYKGEDIAGAVSVLRKALDFRIESGKSLSVIKDLHETYSNELHLRQLGEYRQTLSSSPFHLPDYDRIDGVMTSLSRALRDNVYSGKARSEAEALYKEFHARFQKLRVDAQQKRQSEILKKLETTDPEKSADAYVTLVEELRSVGGQLPETMDADYRAAQERSYILPDNLKKFDNYVIERSLGRGGFASVFLASPKGVSFQAALKIFSPDPSLVRESGLSLAELKERFRREAGIMLRLSTERIPGIVNARHTETWRGKPYLAMDYYPKNLSALIGSDDDLLQTGRGGHLSYDKALPIISRILTSIHRLHTRKEPIIHRDLKPANILLDKNDRPYIADFGLAREASRADLLSKAFQTATGTHLATQYYGAPEQRGGFKETDKRADVFSLGVIIYRMLTGRLIGFHDLEPIELYVEGLGKDTAGRINDLLNKATRIEVDQRLADVSTLLEVFSVEQASAEIGRAPTGPTPEHQFLTALEMAYSFAPDGKLPDNVRATLIAKLQELGIGRSEAELLEKDFRDRLGLSQARGDRVVSATSGSALKTGDEKNVGTLVITSEPEMATVSVDGMERGKTPLTIDRIGAGNRTIRLKMDGFFPVSRIERINSDKETKIHVILEHQTGSIHVTAQTFSDAYPARLYLDGKLMGRPPLTVADVTAGTHAYRLEADHHQEATGEIVVSLDAELKLDETLKPLPGIVSIKTTPPGAAIWVDGKELTGKTNFKAEIPIGEHTLTLKLDSYLDATKKIKVLPGSVLEENLRLISNKGRISVATLPEGADVWLDGKNTLKRTDCLLEVLAGDHELVLMLDGYKNIKKMVSIEPEGFFQAEYRLGKEVNSLAVKSATFSLTQADGNSLNYGNRVVKGDNTGLGRIGELLKNWKVFVATICGSLVILGYVMMFGKSDHNAEQGLKNGRENQGISEKATTEYYDTWTKQRIAEETKKYNEPVPNSVYSQIEEKYKDFISIPPFEVLKAYFEGETQYQRLTGKRPLLYKTNLNFRTAYYNHTKNGLIEGKGLTYENGCLTFHFAEFHLQIERWKATELGVGSTNLVFPVEYLGKAPISPAKSEEFFQYYYHNDFTLFLLYSPKGAKRYENEHGFTRLDLEAIPLQLLFYDPKKGESIVFRIEEAQISYAGKSHPSAILKESGVSLDQTPIERLDAEELGKKIESLVNNGKITEALKILNKAIELNQGPKEAYYYYLRGSIYANSKPEDSNKAIQDLNKAIELDPAYGVAYNARGVLSNNLQQYNKAIQDLNKAIELNPGYWDNYSSRGISYFNLKQYSRAIQDLNKAKELNPSDYFVYYSLGRVYGILNKYTTAIQNLDKAIELNHRYADAYKIRGVCYVKLGEKDQGCADLKKAYELGSNDDLLTSFCN